MIPKHLMIVDDHEDILFFLEQGIRQTWPNFSVITMKSGLDALQYLKKAPVDLMLIDYKMPGMNGLELAEAVRKIAPKTRIIMMSSVDPPELKMTTGPYDAYLDKPFGISAIRPLVTACC